MDNDKNKRLLQPKYQIKIFGNVITFKNIWQMLIAIAIIWAVAKPYVDSYFKMNEQVKAKSINVDDVCEDIENKFNSKYVDANTYRSTLKRWYNTRTIDYAKSQEELSNSLMEQEQRIKNYFDRRIRQAEDYFIKAINKEFDQRFGSYYIYDSTTNVSLNLNLK